MTTVSFKAVLGRQKDSAPAPRSPVACDGVSRTARLLALGWKVRRLLDGGLLPNQREAAARLGMVFPQLTHVINLTYLSPRVQERIVSGELVIPESRLREVCRLAAWQEQEVAAEL